MTREHFKLVGKIFRAQFIIFGLSAVWVTITLLIFNLWNRISYPEFFELATTCLILNLATWLLFETRRWIILFVILNLLIWAGLIAYVSISLYTDSVNLVNLTSIFVTIIGNLVLRDFAKLRLVEDD